MENRKTFSIVFYLLGIVVFFSSCNKPDAKDIIKTTGKIITEKRYLNNLVAVKLFDRIHLVLVQDSLNFILVKAGKNLLPKIKTEISNDTLTIDNLNKFNFLRNFKDSIITELHLKNLNYLRYESAGNIWTQNKFKLSKFSLDSWNGSGMVDLDMSCNEISFAFHTGPGDLNLKGEGSDLYLYCAGQGFLNTEKFDSKRVQINSIGSGGITVRAEEQLLVDIGGEGNVYYYGNPPVVKKKNFGKGDLVKR